MARGRALLTLVAAAAALSLGSPAAADCTGPEIDVLPARVSSEDQLTITGSGWGDACNDTPGLGCDPPPLGDPIQNIRLELDGVPVGTVDADDQYSFETTIEVPDLSPGRYVLRATGEGGRTTGVIRVVRT